MSLTIDQAVVLAQAAGFTGDGLVTIVAIAIAESDLDPNARGTNGPTDGCPNGSVDRGVLQINSCYEAQFSDAQAYDPVAAFQAGWIISQGGTRFQPWVTYTGGHYRAHVDDVRAAIASSVVTPPAVVAPGVVGGAEPGASGLSAEMILLGAVLLVLALVEG